MPDTTLDQTNARLVAHFAPLFPSRQPRANRPEFHHIDVWAEFEAARLRYINESLLPCWHGLAPVYAESLAWSDDEHDTTRLAVEVSDWPITWEDQQNSLQQLMDGSKLRQAWRSHTQWVLAQRHRYSPGQSRVHAELEREDLEAGTPMAEIPLYNGFMRVSSQQVICMPVAQWDALYDDSAVYAPDTIDVKTVRRLQRRLARVFNTPPLALSERFLQSPACGEPIIWPCSAGRLTTHIDGHGMTDRFSDDYGRPREGLTDHMPSWRYDGFCGQLSVVLEGGSRWYVTILAPTHFIGALLHYED